MHWTARCKGGQQLLQSLLAADADFAPPACSLLAFKLMPLRVLGADGWKVAAALTARHIVSAARAARVLAASTRACDAAWPCLHAAWHWR